MTATTAPDLDTHPERDLLNRLETYYDAVPRGGAVVEDFGPLSLFVRQGPGWPFYARPALGWSGRAVEAADVARVRARQRELGAPESFEWVAECAPTLRVAVEETGLAVHAHPLMVLDLDASDPAPVPALQTEPDVLVRIVGAQDPALPSALAVPRLAFAVPGTLVGPAGRAELAAAVEECVADGSVDRTTDRILAGLTVVAAAIAGNTALCAGQHQPVGDVSEIVGVGTLPSARRQGLGLAVTAALVADARSRGIRTVLLSATDDAVARVYARAGFRRIGTALIAEPAE